MILKVHFRISVLTVVILLLLFSSVSCNKKVSEKVIPVAKVYDKYLYLSDIQHFFHGKMSKDNSILQVQSYINTWIKNQLLLNKAELNLPPEQLDISDQIESYRSSLLIYKYEDHMLKAKVDTLVSEQEMEDYYKGNQASFLLDNAIVKALYLKLKKTAPDIDKVRSWYKSSNMDDYKKLESYCYNYATKYDYFNDDWVDFVLLQRQLPIHIDNEDEVLRHSKTIEQQDDDFYYFVYIKDYVEKGVIAPLVYAKPKIKDILINKRKVNYLRDLETKIFNDAQDHNYFIIYNIENK